MLVVELLYIVFHFPMCHINQTLRVAEAVLLFLVTLALDRRILTQFFPFLDVLCVINVIDFPVFGREKVAGCILSYDVRNCHACGYFRLRRIDKVVALQILSPVLDIGVHRLALMSVHFLIVGPISILNQHVLYICEITMHPMIMRLISLVLLVNCEAKFGQWILLIHTKSHLIAASLPRYVGSCVH